MDVFVPKGDKNGLGVVDVVSGAWHSDRGKIGDHMKAGIYDVFCERGYTVFGVRPGSVTKFTASEMVEHVKSGIRYVKLHAAEYGVDPNQLTLVGASAGGHLATLTALTAEPGKADAKDPKDRLDTTVKVVTVFFPPTDFLDWDGKPMTLRARAGLFVNNPDKVTDEELTEAARKVSPALLVGEQPLPPFLLIHGDADPLVPLQQSQKFVDAVKAAGGSAELIVKPGGQHPWPTIREEVAVMADWVAKHVDAPAKK
jgi:acetyl esterase/lipase